MLEEEEAGRMNKMGVKMLEKCDRKVEKRAVSKRRGRLTFICLVVVI